ncbi:MAG: flagellar FliJ family protein [Rhodothalassiaceae bacterium]
MKGLDGMIRLAKWQLDEARKALIEAEAALAEIDHALDALAREEMREHEAAPDDPAAMFALGGFVAALRARRQSLVAEREKRESVRAQRQDTLAEAFQELKKYEILARRAAERAAEEERQREQAALDEVGLRQHRRSPAPGH